MLQSNLPRTPAALRQALLAPRSIAIVGASDDPTKTSSRPLQYLRRAGYRGAIYPINPRRDTVLGERAWPSLSALPEAPDHAFILAPTKDVVNTAAECAAAGVTVATILATGFSSGDAGGDARAVELKDIARRTQLRILGPSSIGVVGLHSKTILTANAAFAESDLPRGGIFVASHSGSLLGALVSRGKARGVGFAGLVSVGNEIDLSLGEICSATLDDPEVTSYLLFLESLRNADDLRRFAIAAAERGKPVVAYKLGRSAQGAELALSHTGALAGADDVANAFLHDTGIARVHLFESLLETLPLLRRLPPRSSPRPPRVGVVTTTGGGAAMVVDGLGLAGIEVGKCSDATFASLTATGVAANHERIIDLTMAGTRYEVMKAALDAMLAAPDFDLVVAVIGSSARFQPELAVKPIVDCAGAATPLAAFIVPEAPEALAMLAAGGVPAFRTPESCVDAIVAALGRGVATPMPDLPALPPATALAQLDEWDAYALLDELGVPHAPGVKIAVDAALPDLPFAYPVAVKLLSDKVAHKTDLGGVVLNVADAAALRAAIDSIVGSVKRKRPDLPLTHVLVQPMSAGLSEMLLGYRRDPDAGPIVLLAAGGVFTEIYRDRSLRLAPVDREAALAMIGELKMSQILRGYRGKPPADIDRLADAIVAFSQLALRGEPCVVDAEINPLIVREQGRGVLALDAVVTFVGTP